MNDQEARRHTVCCFVPVEWLDGKCPQCGSNTVSEEVEHEDR